MNFKQLNPSTQAALRAGQAKIRTLQQSGPSASAPAGATVSAKLAATTGTKLRAPVPQRKRHRL